MRRIFTGARVDRVENAYLAILRIAVLAVASLCLAAAIMFAVDGLWRVMVSTHVQVKPTVVSGAEITAAIRSAPPADDDSSAPSGISAGVKAAHAAFAKNVFPAYYAVYSRAANAYRKPEDRTLSQSEVMNALGYSLEDYAAGRSMATKLFVEDVEYQRQAQAAVAAAMSDPQTLRLFRQYKAATKSQQHCTNTNQTRTVSQICGYYYQYDCSYTETVPVHRCEAVYPEGIVSPGTAFVRADRAFQDIWLERSDLNATSAEVETGKRFMTRAQIGPKLMLALQILAAFLAVMFFFLIIAIERHLRRLAGAEVKTSPAPREEATAS